MTSPVNSRFLLIVLVSFFSFTYAQWSGRDDEDTNDALAWWRPKQTSSTAFVWPYTTAPRMKPTPTQGNEDGLWKLSNPRKSSPPQPEGPSSVRITPADITSLSVPSTLSWTPQTSDTLATTFLTPTPSTEAVPSSLMSSVVPAFSISPSAKPMPQKTPQKSPIAPFSGDAPTLLNATAVVASFDRSFANIAGPNSTITLAGRYMWDNPRGERIQQQSFAYQGGVWLPDREEIWFTSETHRPPSSLFMLRLPFNTVLAPLLSHRIPNPVSGYYFNGMTYWAALGDATNPRGIYAADPKTGNVHEVIIDNQGTHLNGPSDVAVFSVGGNASALYFTDGSLGDSIGLNASQPVNQRPPNAIYRYEFASQTTKPMITAAEIDSPKSLCVSADQKHLYVSQARTKSSSPVSQVNNLAHAIFSFSLTPNGDVVPGSKRLFARAVTPGIQDGLKCDDMGNVWSAEGGGIAVRNAAGKTLGGFRSPPLKVGMTGPRSEIANFALAGDELVVLALDQIWRIKLAKSVVGRERFGMPPEDMI